MLAFASLSVLIPLDYGFRSFSDTAMTARVSRLRPIGQRIELVPMDSHCGDITLGLYEQVGDQGTSFLVHTYSSRDGAALRVAYMAKAMSVLGGMVIDRQQETMLRFPCGDAHRVACRRIFLEAAKLPTGSPLESRPLEVFDRRQGDNIELTRLGSRYRAHSVGNSGLHDRRAAVAALGLVRLGDMAPIPDTSDQVRFRCNTPHDAVVGLLLTRALEVRAALREVESRAARGILTAPSSQAR